MTTLTSTNGAVIIVNEIVFIGRLYDNYYDVTLKSGLALTFSELDRESDFVYCREDLIAIFEEVINAA